MLHARATRARAVQSRGRARGDRRGRARRPWCGHARRRDGGGDAEDRDARCNGDARQSMSRADALAHALGRRPCVAARAHRARKHARRALTRANASDTPWRCPICARDDDAQAPLRRTELGKTIQCSRASHAFDAHRSGYVNLLPTKSKASGDGAAQLRARREFLSRGAYAELAEAAAASALERALGAIGDAEPARANEDDETRASDARASSPRAKKLAKKRGERLAERARRPAQPPRRKSATRVLDLGCGEGYYAAAVRDYARERACAIELVCVDASKDACEMCAKMVPEAWTCVADATSTLPFYDGTIDVVLSVFAPRVPKELARVLRGNGRVVVCQPEPEHMRELREDADVGVTVVAVEPGKSERVEEGMSNAGFKVISHRSIRGTMSLNGDAMANLVLMGPSGYHNDMDAIEKVRARVDAVDVTKAFTVTVFEKLT